MPAVAESIGYNSTLFLDDGGSNAYVQVFNIVSYDAGGPTLGTAESKRLDLTNATLVEVATLLKPGDITWKQQFSNAGFTRNNTILLARSPKNVKTTTMDDSTGTVIIAPGYLVENKHNVESDKITELDVKWTVRGVRS